MPIDTQLAEELATQINGLRRVLRRRLRATLTDQPLAGGQVELLRLVETEPGISVSAAARALQLAGNTVSTLVNQLTTTGYLRRDTDPRDRRGAQLHLTKAATRRLDAWRDRRAELIASTLATLGKDDRDALAHALPALARLTRALAEEAPWPRLPYASRTWATASASVSPSTASTSPSKPERSSAFWARTGPARRPRPA